MSVVEYGNRLMNLFNQVCYDSSIFFKKTNLFILTGFSETPLPAFYKQMSERPTMGGLSYNPSLGLVPQLSLPDNLPDLGNYATFDDNTTIDWTKQQMASIAPSYVISMLPDINDLSSTTTTAPSVEPPKPAGKYFFSLDSKKNNFFI
jgi:hypothetical protein